MGQRVVISSTQVGLIVRGMDHPGHDPSVLAQHADCILPDGSPIGFFGQGPAYTGERSGSGSSMNLGVNMHGVVIDHQALSAQRPWYVDARMAKANVVRSTVIIIDVGAAAAARFNEAWRLKTLNPGGFSMLGNNCSTNASGAFVDAGILSVGIPGLDTPVHLFQQLRSLRPNKTTVYSGYVGFDKRADGKPGFDLIVE